MPLTKDITFKCPECGEEIPLTLWQSVNTAENPKEAEALAYGDLFYIQCPKCGYHMRMGARARLEAFLDYDSPKEEIGAEILAKDPLKFVDSKPYPKRIAEARAKTTETDALVVMAGQLKHYPVVAAAFEFGFMGGSMGSVVGERFVRGVGYLIHDL